jgi:hypothetical protein
MVLDLFLAGAGVLWLSVFGYPLALADLARGRRHAARGREPRLPSGRGQRRLARAGCLEKATRALERGARAAGVCS